MERFSILHNTYAKRILASAHWSQVKSRGSYDRRDSCVIMSVSSFPCYGQDRSGHITMSLLHYLSSKLVLAGKMKS